MLCAEKAQLGYVAIAPELFARQGDVSKLKDVNEIRKIVAKVPDPQVLADIDASLNWVVLNAKGSIDRVAITGFCWGGRITSARSLILEKGKGFKSHGA
jgi:carboxymethylenebutenolidase